MIITRGILHRLSPSIRESAPETGDDVVQVPPRFSFVGLPPEPQRVVASGINLLTTSGTIHVNGQVINGVQIVVSVMVLAAGYWRVHINGAYRSNYVVQSNLGGDWRLLLADGTSTAGLISVYASAASPVQKFDYVEEFLVRETLTFTQVLEANIATQEHTIDYSLVANRLL